VILFFINDNLRNVTITKYLFRLTTSKQEKQPMEWNRLFQYISSVGAKRRILPISRIR